MLQECCRDGNVSFDQVGWYCSNVAEMAMYHLIRWDDVSAMMQRWQCIIWSGGMMLQQCCRDGNVSFDQVGWYCSNVAEMVMYHLIRWDDIAAMLQKWQCIIWSGGMMLQECCRDGNVSFDQVGWCCSNVAEMAMYHLIRWDDVAGMLQRWQCIIWSGGMIMQQCCRDGNVSFDQVGWCCSNVAEMAMYHLIRWNDVAGLLQRWQCIIWSGGMILQQCCRDGNVSFDQVGWCCRNVAEMAMLHLIRWDDISAMLQRWQCIIWSGGMMLQQCCRDGNVSFDQVGWCCWNVVEMAMYHLIRWDDIAAMLQRWQCIIWSDEMILQQCCRDGNVSFDQVGWCCSNVAEMAMYHLIRWDDIAAMLQRWQCIIGSGGMILQQCCRNGNVSFDQVGWCFSNVAEMAMYHLIRWDDVAAILQRWQCIIWSGGMMLQQCCRDGNVAFDQVGWCCSNVAEMAMYHLIRWDHIAAMLQR